MSKLLFVAPLAFATACASDPPPSTVGADVQGPPLAGASINVAPTLYAGFWYRPESCNDNSLMLYPVLRYSDNSSTANVVCQYAFPDGSVVDSCGVTHSIPTPGTVTFTARDTVTGATATYSELLVGPPTLSATIDVTTAGDTLSWDAHTLFGNAQDVGDVAISIDPAANVVETDPALFRQLSGTVHLTTDGTYTVTVQAGVQFADEGGCSTTATGSVDVDCNGNGSDLGNGR